MWNTSRTSALAVVAAVALLIAGACGGGGGGGGGKDAAKPPAGSKAPAAKDGAAAPKPLADALEPAQKSTSTSPRKFTDRSGSSAAPLAIGKGVTDRDVVQVREVIAHLNAGKSREAAAGFSADSEWVDVGGMMPPHKGPDGIKRSLQMARIAFPDLKLQVRSMYAAGEAIAVHGVMTGKHDGDYLDVTATGKQVGWEGLWFFWTGEKGVRKVVAYADGRTLMTQIGALPAAGRAAAPVPTVPEGEPALYTAKGEDGLVALARRVLETPADDSALKPLLAPAVEFHYAPHGNVVRGADAYIAALAHQDAAFPKAKLTIEGIDAAGSWVVVRLVWTATNSGPLSKEQGPTGATVTMRAAELLRFSDRKLAERWRFENHLALGAQLGI